jgi:hypothetical protein
VPHRSGFWNGGAFDFALVFQFLSMLNTSVIEEQEIPPLKSVKSQNRSIASDSSLGMDAEE